MSPRQPGPYDSVARKWLALAERRKASFVELSHSGRWRHYYTAAQFRNEISKADGLCANWAGIVGPAPGAMPGPDPQTAAAAPPPPAAGLDSEDGAEASHLLLLRQSLGLLPG
jgi:hypothetical protein